MKVVLKKNTPMEYQCSEAYKILRTNILFCGSQIKTICLTSCLPNEGKSTVSFNMALSFAASGKKVIFIDADLRRSTILGKFIVDQEVLGLSQYLSGQASIDHIIYDTNIEGLDMIFTGPIPPNPSELLSGENFNFLLQCLKELYDYVIIDTPPLGSVIDSAIVSKNSDGTILVISSNDTSSKLMAKIKGQLEQMDCRILGTVLNKVKSNRDYYGNYNKKYIKYASK